MLRISLKKLYYTESNYGNYKHFNKVSFKENLKTAFSNNEIQAREDFEENVKDILDYHVSF